MYKVTITVNEITRVWQGDYDQMHVNDWEDEVRELLDLAQEYESKN